MNPTDPTLSSPGPGDGPHTAPRGAGSSHQRPTPPTTPAPADPFPPDADTPSALPSGTVLAGRYRIITPLGKGGMGEVFRADDLTLGTPVALKFLPAALAADPLRLERFRAEVRLARQVAHPNACRVFDIAEVGGSVFLAMDYIDGEDLASLLRRIGRLPREKAVETARQICFGLAAVHDAGLIHRDLKPANIMMDGRGRARLTDFGLASHGDLSGRAAIAGTPLYMAPEQMAGIAADKHSDIYALGLVLFELFTGRHAHGLGQSATWADLQRVHQSNTPSSTPSALVADMDPAAERIILRCLEHDPARRPRSAVAVAAALPGGDALQAALAAGEMPSPELVAQAGMAEGAGGLSARTAAVLLSLFAVGILIAALLVQRTSLLRVAPAELSVEVLTQKARETLDKLGYDTRSGWSASGLTADSSSLSSGAAEAMPGDTPIARARALRTGIAHATPPGLLFWYRSSPMPLAPEVMSAGRVGPRTKPLYYVGDVLVFLDTRGRLNALEGVPPSLREPAAGASPSAAATDTATPPPQPDWNAVLSLAGFDPATLTPAPALRTPWHAADTRLAWDGFWPPGPDGVKGPPVRIEGMSERGKVTAFRTIAPWNTQPGRTVTAAARAQSAPREWMERGFILSIFAASNVLAWLNIRAKRCDVRGAIRLAASVTAMVWFARVLVAPSTRAMFDPDHQLGTTMAAAAWNGFVCLLLYLALEPFVRRLWPEQIITWVRLLDGRIRDRRLCADVLLGGALGTILVVAVSTLPAAMEFAGAGFPGLTAQGLDEADSWRFALGGTLISIALAARYAIVSAFLLVLGVLLVRVRWAATVMGALGITIFQSMESGSGWDALIANALIAAATTALLVRRGLAAAVAAVLCARVVLRMPLAIDPAAWYLPSTIVGVGPVVLLMGWAAYHAVRGRAATE